ncbi:DUF2147 domain-containing protein [Parasphingorhabdus litoris]|nr:DUF2147 domain-containing protein [Parasphingorhabdus litoris]
MKLKTTVSELQTSLSIMSLYLSSVTCELLLRFWKEKNMKLIAAVMALPLMAISSLPNEDPPFQPYDILGIFLTDEGSTLVEIFDCGDGSPCGRFLWFHPDAPPKGARKHTRFGDPGRPLLGSLMLNGFSRRNEDWRGGKIYDSDNDKTYHARLKRLPDGSLQVKGCIGLFCQTQVWTSVIVDQP